MLPFLGISEVPQQDPLNIFATQQVIQIEEPTEPEPQLYTIEENDSLVKIADRYEIDWQRIYDKNTDIENPDLLEVGMEITIPETDEELVEREIPVPQVNTPQTAQKVVRAAVGGSNTYVRGQCTWFAKNYTGWVPNGWRNANRWDNNARAQGYYVGPVPKVGAVAQTDRGYYGHVAVVTAINGDMVSVIEMNYSAPYRVTERTVHKSSFNYIY